MYVKYIRRMFSHELQDFTDHRKIDQKFIRPADHRHRDQSVQHKFKMISAPFTVPEHKKCTHDNRFYRKLKDFIHPFVSDNHKIADSLQYILICKTYCKRHHKQIFCKMHMLFNQKASRKQKHKYDQPTVFPIKTQNKRKKYDEKYFQT